MTTGNARPEAEIPSPSFRVIACAWLFDAVEVSLKIARDQRVCPVEVLAIVGAV
jgi:hypothetical protein